MTCHRKAASDEWLGMDETSRPPRSRDFRLRRAAFTSSGEHHESPYHCSPSCILRHLRDGSASIEYTQPVHQLGHLLHDRPIRQSQKRCKRQRPAPETVAPPRSGEAACNVGRRCADAVPLAADCQIEIWDTGRRLLSMTARTTICSYSSGSGSPSSEINSPVRCDPHLGEVAFIDIHQRRTAAVRAREPTVTARLAELDFPRIANLHPHLWRELAIETSLRLAQRLHGA